MKISTRGRYALRVMVDMAEKGDGNYMPLKDIAKRQEISQKYLESIATDLSKAGLIDGQHGKGGGYKLSRSPESITVLEVLTVTEGELSPVACLDDSSAPCPRAAGCRTLPMWENFYKTVRDYFGGITLADLTRSDEGCGNYII